MKIIIVVLTAFVFVLASAAAQENAIEVKTAIPASQKDVQILQKQIQRLRLENLAIEKKSAARSEAERQKLEENSEKIASTEASLRAMLISIAREAQRAERDQMRRERNVWYLLGTAGLIGAVIVIFVFLWVRRGRKILVDPEIADLKEYSARHGNTKKVPFILRLDDREFKGIASLHGEEITARFENDSKDIVWKNRKKRALEMSGMARNLVACTN